LSQNAPQQVKFANKQLKIKIFALEFKENIDKKEQLVAKSRQQAQLFCSFFCAKRFLVR
jgi:hypothetical protein